MDKNYIKALSIAEEASSKINNLYEKVDVEGFENYRGYKATEKVIEDLEDFTRTIEHYSKLTKEGYLELNRNGRYQLKGIELTCGYPVEIYNREYNEWNDGRIEHSSDYNGYYFYNYDEEHISLNDGMKARVRI
ncbi:DUF5348 domain-containing protein [Clostridium sp. P21]|uniref:DUF5348 domain-containing protein n=1 Tax=Clostridium muellerianum TaxID=2716538 RepID=A0A7Y0EJ13_9CLOT|nr:DUF5348 domain-containing protein [Clostridium muellerianum]